MKTPTRGLTPCSRQRAASRTLRLMPDANTQPYCLGGHATVRRGFEVVRDWLNRCTHWIALRGSGQRLEKCPIIGNYSEQT